MIIDAEWEEIPQEVVKARRKLRNKQKYAVHLMVYLIAPLFALAIGKMIGLMLWGGVSE